MVRRPQVKKIDPTHDEVQGCLAHITNYAKTTRPSRAECEAKELLKMAALAKHLGWRHDEKDDGEACIRRSSHVIITKRIKVMSLLYVPERSSSGCKDWWTARGKIGRLERWPNQTFCGVS